MTDDTRQFALEEFRALRATIRERGTARLWLALTAFVSWGALSGAAHALFLPLLTLTSLLILFAGFEIVFAAHVGVERIGRYLHVHYEPTEGLPAWEHAVARLVATAPLERSRVDPLLAWPFLLAVMLNFVSAAALVAAAVLRPWPLPVEIGVLALLHGLVVLRILQAQRFARRQRQRDLEAFERAAGVTPRE